MYNDHDQDRISLTKEPIDQSIKYLRLFFLGSVVSDPLKSPPPPPLPLSGIAGYAGAVVKPLNIIRFIL